MILHSCSSSYIIIFLHNLVIAQMPFRYGLEERCQSINAGSTCRRKTTLTTGSTFASKVSAFLFFYDLVVIFNIFY